MNDMNFAVPFGKATPDQQIVSTPGCDGKSAPAHNHIPTRRMLPHLIARVMGNKYTPDGVPARVRKVERKGAEMIVKEMKDGH